MGVIKALLVGVSKYVKLKCDPLPLCKNDLYAMRNALIYGLNTNSDNILLCGESGVVTLNELIISIQTVFKNTTKEDTLFFYFSGHGGKNCLVLSDCSIKLQCLLDTIGEIPAKNKIAILDSCHAGGFSLDNVPEKHINETAEHFVGRGFAVMASCGADQSSGFNYDRRISLYTSFVCDALNSPYLIKKGKKSLEMINEAVFHFAEISNKKSGSFFQQPIFRSSIGGTIFFDVEEYNPYKVAEIYEETDKYIIYSIDPVHIEGAKRLSAKIILRFQSTIEQIADISLEIKNKILYYDIHQNKNAEIYHKGNAANIIWCFFGYTEDDIINSNYVYRTTWTENSQNKDWGYHDSNDSIVVKGIQVDVYDSYELIKSLKKNTIDKKNFIETTRILTSKIISAAEHYIKIFREYQNNTITEEQFINIIMPINTEISKYFFALNDLPIPPKELHDWTFIQKKLSSTIHNFSLFYDKKNLRIWKSKQRKSLLSNAIKQYEQELEELKTVDKLV